jgi:hypothetical protein
VQLLRLVTLAHGLAQLAQLLGEPGDRRGRAPAAVALAVRARHEPLEVIQVHARSMAQGP